MWKRHVWALLLVPLVLTAGFLIACGAGDDGDQDGNQGHMGDANMGGMGQMASPGVVNPKPNGATQVDVTMREWAIATGQSSVKAGKIYFLVKNVGPDHAHEFVVIRTDLGPLDLPFKDNKVIEDEVDVVDEIEEYAPNSSASLTVDLASGTYLLICNITEVDQSIGSHYKRGMVATFRVE